MAFEKKTWKDRLVEYAGRRKITNTTTLAAQIVDMERAEGIVSEEGSAFNAANMNDLEQRVADGFSGVQQDINKVNSDLGGCQFGFTFDGLPGYKKVGADTVYPFKGWYYLGEGYSFDLKSFTDYSNFTIDNFIVGSSSAGASQSGGHGEFNTYAKINGFSLSKSYDNKLGILTINGYSQLAGCWDIDGYWRYTVTQNVKCFAYLIYK